MAAISANLLAATAPPLNPPVNGSEGTSPPAARSGFAELLADITSTTAPTSQVDTLAGLAELTDTTDTAEATDASGGAVVLAALGLIAQQPLPADVIAPLPAGTTTLDSAVTTVPPTDLTAATNSPPVPETSRAEQLRFESAPSARIPTNSVKLPIDPLSDAPLTSTEQPARVTGTLPAQTPVSVTPNSVVPTTPVEAGPAAARIPAVVAQTPIVTDRSQQLPATPPEVGYGLIGPTVVGAPPVQAVPPVGVGVSQQQVELRATQLPAVEPGPQPTADTKVVPARPFAEVVGATTAVTSRAEEPIRPMVSATPFTQPATPVAATVTPVVTNDTPALAPTSSAIASTPVPAEQTIASAITPTERPVFTPPNATVPGAAVKVPTVASQELPTTTGVPPATAMMELGDRPASEGGELTFSAPAPLPPTAAEPTPVTSTRVAPNSPPPVAAQVSEALISHARVVEKGGTHEFQMRLDPPELGEVKVRLLAMGDRVEARLVVSDDAVKRLIESQLPELRQKLEAAGVSVPSFDVTTDSGGRTGGDGWDRPQPAFAPAPKSAGPLPRAARPAPSGGTLDVTA